MSEKQYLQGDLIKYLSDLINALKTVSGGEVSYGEFHVSEVRVAFDGEDLNVRVVPSEVNGYDVEIGGDE